MKETVNNVKGRIGGISLYHKRGPEYMKKIGRNGAMKRSCKNGGRPKACKFSEITMIRNKSGCNGNHPDTIKDMLVILKKRQIIKSFEPSKENLSA